MSAKMTGADVSEFGDSPTTTARKRVNSARHLRRTSKNVTFKVKEDDGHDPADETRDEKMNKLKALKAHAESIEHRIPMLSFKTSDEMIQIKRFVSIYYQPILTSIEIEMLELNDSSAQDMDKMYGLTIE